MFQLTKEEWENLIFHSGISKKQHGGRRFMPHALHRKNDKRVNEIIIALNNLIAQPKETKTIGFKTGNP